MTGILKNYTPAISNFTPNRLTKDNPKVLMLVKSAEDKDIWLKLVEGKYELSVVGEGELKKQTRINGYFVDKSAKTITKSYLDLPRASFAKNMLPVLNSEYATELVEFSVNNAGTMQAAYSCICLPQSVLDEVNTYNIIEATEEAKEVDTDF